MGLEESFVCLYHVFKPRTQFPRTIIKTTEDRNTTRMSNAARVVRSNVHQLRDPCLFAGARLHPDWQLVELQQAISPHRLHVQESLDAARCTNGRVHEEVNGRGTAPGVEACFLSFGKLLPENNVAPPSES